MRLKNGNDGMKKTNATTDQKLFSDAAAAVHKLNGHVTPDVAVIQECGQKLLSLCPISYDEYEVLPRKNATRCVTRYAWL